MSSSFLSGLTNILSSGVKGLTTVAAPIIGMATGGTGTGLLASMFPGGLSDIGQPLLKAGLGAMADIGSGWLGNELVGKPNADKAYLQSSQAAATSFERSYDAYKRRYQDTVEDMRKAGINPILAASAGFKVGSSPQAQTAQAFQAQPIDIQSTKSGLNISSSQLNTSKVIETVKKADTQVALVKKIRQEVKESIQRVSNLKENKKLISSQTKAKLQQALNLEKDWWIKSQQLIQITKNISLMGTQQKINQENIKKIKLERSKLKAEAETIAQNLIEIQKEAKVYGGPIGQTLAYIKAIMSALNLNIGILPIVGGK